MASKTVEIVEKSIAPLVKSMGYEIVEVEFAKRVDGMNLEITIDSENRVNIDDCEKVHRAIDVPLDELDPTDGAPYILSVSSPGIDRPVKNHYDFLRNKGKEVDIKLYSKLDGKKEFIGLLDVFNDEQIVILVDNKPIAFKRESVACITPVIKF